MGFALADESPIRPDDSSSANPMRPAKTNEKSPLQPATANEKSPLDSPRESKKSPMQPAQDPSKKSPTRSVGEANTSTPINPTNGESVAPKGNGTVASEESSLQRPKTNFTAVGVKPPKSSSKSQERRGNK